MPSDLPLDFSPVRDELTKYFRDNWDSIINSEIDGEKSKAAELDRNNGRFGNLLAARKIARVIFMGTAPIGKVSGVRGIEENEIRLGTIQPADVGSVSIFNDALSKLKENLYYLYSQDERLWFGVNPTLRKLVDDKRGQFSDGDIDYTIEQRLKSWKGREKFKGVHLCPKNSGEVPDEQTARLVILSPKYDGQKGIDAAQDILENRGTVPRRWKNMLVFMAADAGRLKELDAAVREYSAWRDVLKEDLNLDDIRRRDANNNLKSATMNFEMKVSQAYSKILAPYTDEKNVSEFHWNVGDINCLNGENIFEAEKKFLSKELLLALMGEKALKRTLDNFIWRDRDSVDGDQLWEYFMTYCYLPRLVDRSALFAAINRGDQSKLFSLADNVLHKELPIAQQPIDDEPKAVEPAVNPDVEVERDVEIFIRVD